jgi:hypothetical protein
MARAQNAPYGAPDAEDNPHEPETRRQRIAGYHGVLLVTGRVDGDPVGVKAAFALLRGYVRGHQVRLHDIAPRITHGTFRLDQLTEVPPQSL